MKVKKKLSPLLICLIILSALLLVIALFYFSNIIIKTIIGFGLFIFAIAIICLIIDFQNDPNKD